MKLLIQLSPPHSIIPPLCQLFPPLFPLSIKFFSCLLYPFIFYPSIISPFFLSNTVPMILIVPTEFLCMVAVSTFWFKYYWLHTIKRLFLCLNIYVLSKPLCLNTYYNQKILLWGFVLHLYGVAKVRSGKCKFHLFAFMDE